MGAPGDLPHASPTVAVAGLLTGAHKGWEIIFFSLKIERKKSKPGAEKKKLLVKPKHGAAGMLWVLAEAANFWVMGWGENLTQREQEVLWLDSASPSRLLSQQIPPQKSGDSVRNLGLNHHYDDSFGNLIFELASLVVCLLNTKPAFHTNPPNVCRSSAHEGKGAQKFSGAS